MGPTVRLYYDTVVAIALMAVFAIVCGFVAAVITGGSPPNFTIAGIAFLLAGAVWFFAIRKRLVILPPDLASRPRGRLPRTTLHTCLMLLAAVIDFADGFGSSPRGHHGGLHP